LERNKEEETSARAILDAANDLIILLDPSGNVLDCNESLLKQLGLFKENIIGKLIYNFFPPGIAKSRKEAVDRVLSSGKKEVIIDKGEGGFFETIISPFKDKGRKISKVVIISRNIEDRFKIEQALVESEKRYRLLAENSEDVIWTFDIKKMKFSYISPSVTKHRGFTIEEAMAGSPQDAVLPIYGDHLIERMLQRIKLYNSGDQSQLVQVYQVEQPCKNGSVKPVEILSKLILNDEDEVIEVLGISRDISEIRQYQQKLEKALEKAEESDRLKSAFLANMSHEIRTPMNGIIGFADLLSDPDLPLEKRTKYAEIININGRHLLSIINDIIDISKIEAGQVSVKEYELDVNVLLEDLFTFFNSSKFRDSKVNVKVKSKLKEEDSIVFIDEVKIKQVLNNLISNALKFTEKGFVEYGCSIVEIEKKPFLLFVVSDTGLGIAKTDHAGIFDRFQQANYTTNKKYGGTGLGLAISKAYIELMGGKIWIDSDIGKGSKFYFTIPYKQPDSQKEHDPSINYYDFNDFNWNDKTILIVEDEFSNFYFLSEILSLTGAKIIHALNGKESVNICSQHKNIDLILMDIKMPEMNGYEATFLIKKMKPDLPIIAQTAYAFSDDFQKSLEAGCDDYISKPIVKELLIEKLAVYLNK